VSDSKNEELAIINNNNNNDDNKKIIKDKPGPNANEMGGRCLCWLHSGHRKGN
jgi:hypothetical protein